MKVPASIQRPLAPPRRGGAPCYHLGGVEVGAPGLHGHRWGKHYSQTDRKSRFPPVFSDTTPWDLVGPLWVRGMSWPHSAIVSGSVYAASETFGQPGLVLSTDFLSCWVATF